MFVVVLIVNVISRYFLKFGLKGDCVSTQRIWDFPFTSHLTPKVPFFVWGLLFVDSVGPFPNLRLPSSWVYDKEFSYLLSSPKGWSRHCTPKCPLMARVWCNFFLKFHSLGLLTLCFPYLCKGSSIQSYPLLRGNANFRVTSLLMIFVFWSFQASTELSPSPAQATMFLLVHFFMSYYFLTKTRNLSLHFSFSVPYLFPL